MRLKAFIGPAIVVALVVACANTPTSTSPMQQALNTMVTSCKGVDSAIVSTDQAVLTGTLKGSTKDAAVKGLTTAQAGCVATLAALQSAAAAASAAASGATP